jgi:hypothetical protein
LLNLITRGHLDDSTPLSVATRGHLNFEGVIEDVKIVVEAPKRQGSPGGISVGHIPSYSRYRIPERVEDERRDVREDDDEIVEIIVQIITSGVLE